VNWEIVWFSLAAIFTTENGISVGDKQGSSKCIQEVVILVLCYQNEDIRLAEDQKSVYVDELNQETTHVVATSNQREGFQTETNSVLYCTAVLSGRPWTR
jgi:hypothetical protein